jgi:hypothetical protein
MKFGKEVSHSTPSSKMSSFLESTAEKKLTVSLFVSNLNKSPRTGSF